MKTNRIRTLWLAGFCLLFTTALNAQDTNINPADSTGLPGDNFSLEGAIELFKKAKSPEDFEKLLNSEDNNVNNLDLNEDGEIDYIRVIDNMDGDAHAIILQVPVNEKESQDIAVIEIEKQQDDYAILQIIGDPDVFGDEVIAEPFEEEAGDKGRGPAVHLKPYRIVVNVMVWPSVRYIYRPGYVVYVSPWRWHYYPTWWSPWRPRPWRTFYVGVRPYHRHCHVVTTHRVVRAHTVYTPRRTHSTVVRTRTTTVKTQRATGTTVGKRTTTTTVRNNGNGRATTQKTTTTRAAEGKNGRAVGTQTTTTKATRTGNNGATTAKSTTTTKAAKGKNGRAVGTQTTTTKATRTGRNGTTTAKRTTTTKAAKGQNGRAAGTKTTKTTVRKKRGG
ncbi:MAG: hypothetical protein EP344_00825 [Bacteroidetes bacterium]|nr:MAG: hypothetical protein EP344_00825 [Bacteroidota bacterium]